jgi:hypothetical protein
VLADSPPWLGLCEDVTGNEKAQQPRQEIGARMGLGGQLVDVTRTCWK